MSSDTEGRGPHELAAGFEALEAWHADLNSVPVMDAAESARLCAQAQAGDRGARNRVVEGNLRLVEFVAARYRGATLSLEDRIGEGMLGLLSAVERYDPRRGSFSTCAVLWIRQAIERGIDDRGRLIRRPAHVEVALRAARRLDQTPRLTAEVAADAEAVQHVGSLDEEVPNIWRFRSAAEGPWTVADKVADEAPGPEETVAEEDQAERLRALLAALLPPRLRLVLVLRFGLDGYTDPATGGAGRTLRATGELLGISYERARQLEREALSTLRAHLALDRDGLPMLRPRRKRSAAAAKRASKASKASKSASAA